MKRVLDPAPPKVAPPKVAPPKIEGARRRRIGLGFGAAFVALALAGVSAPALADTPLEEAKALTNEASVQYKLGRFGSALEGYTHAYEKFPTAGLLFNIAQCHKMLKNYERAIYFYKGYLRDKPDAANRADVTTLITDAEHELEAQRADADAKARATEAVARADEARARAAEAEANLRSSASAPAPASNGNAGPAAAGETPQRGNTARKAVGITAGAAGVILLGTGVYLGLHAASESSSLAQLASQHATWSSHDQSTYDDGSRSARAADVLYVVGGVALAAGAVLSYLGWRTGPSVSIAPTTSAVGTATGSGASLKGASPTGATLQLRGSF